MQIRKHIFLLACTTLLISACDKQNVNITTQYPSWPEEQVFSYDTVDCRDLCCVPANAITIHEAITIGKQLASGTSTDEMYYIKGLVKGFNTSKHEEGMMGYGNGCWYMQDNTHSSVDFYCFQTLGLNGGKFTSMDQIQVGDFVVVYTKIYNYNGTIETMSKGASYVVCSSNDLLYPEKDVDYYTESFATGIDHWTKKIISNPSVEIWKCDTAKSGVTSAQAKAAGTAGAYPEGEVWLVSPAYNLAKHNPKSVKLAFLTYYYFTEATSKNVKDQLRLKVSKDGEHWTDMEIPNFNNGKAQSYKPDTIDISDFISGQTQIAFSYKCTSDFAPKWNITDIHLFDHKRARDCN